MDFIIEFIFELFKIKNPRGPKDNDSINTLIFLLIFFSIIVAFLWGCSKLRLFG